MGITVLAGSGNTIGGALPVLTGSLAGSVSTYIAWELPVISGNLDGNIILSATVDGSLPVIDGFASGRTLENFMSGDLPVFQNDQPVGGTASIPGASLSATNNYCAIGTDLPIIGGSLSTGAIIDGELPIMAGDMSGAIIINSDMQGDLPPLKAGCLYSGAIMAGVLPVFESGQLDCTVNIMATMDGSLPAINGSLSGIVDIMATVPGDYNLPVIHGTMTAGSGASGVLSGSLPVVNNAAEMTGLVGAWASLSGIMPPLGGRIEGFIAPEGVIEWPLPVVSGELFVTIDSDDSERILRNIRHEVR